MTSLPPLVYLHAGGGLPSRAHALLGEQFNIIPLDGAATLESAREASGGEPFNVWATSATTNLALEIAHGEPACVRALVLEAPGPPGDDERRAVLSTIAIPTLVVFGTRDGVTPPETGRVYRETMPNCNYVLLYAAGHDAAADRPEAFANLVSDFFARREAFVVSQRSSLLNP